MTRTPPAHLARNHGALLAAMEQDAREQFSAARAGDLRDSLPVAWDPVGAAPGSDPGHGLLDCVAAALDVVWGYQHAWADESFLPLAQLPESSARLLSLIGHRPRPALSATGLQQLRLKAGAAATIPPGFAVSAPGGAEVAEAVFETDAAIHGDARLNTLQPFAVVPPPAVEAVPPSLTLAPPPLPLRRSGASLAEQLAARLQAAQRGAALARDAARARSDALRLADLAASLSAAGADEECAPVFEQLCDELCAQAEALVAADTAASAEPPLPMSEAQQLLLGGLARIDAAMPQALQGLQDAVCQLAGEDDRAYAARLNGLAAFLDALVEGILAQARDDVVRLRGPRGLSPVDRAARVRLRPGELGVALPGTDRLYLMPETGQEDGPGTHAALLRPGDHLVLAEVVEVPAADGTTTLQRGREAVRVVRADDQVAPLLGERATHLVFAPPLQRRYDLARTVLLGNIAPVSHGRTRTLTVTGPGPWLLRDAADLTWLPDPSAPDGRRPAVEVSVGGEDWTGVADVTQAAADARVFDVTLGADGIPVLRTGDGRSGAVVPPDAAVRITLRTGTGAAGNRDAGAISSIVAPVPEIVTTANPLRVSGGVDAEAPALARARASGGVRTLDRAVTASDVTALLLAHGLVTRATVTASEAARPRQLRAVVTGEGGRTLSADEHATLARFLAARVPPGVTITLENRVIVTVRATLRLALHADADPLAVLAGARARLGAQTTAGDVAEAGLLHPARVRLGQDLHLSDLHGALHGLEGLGYTVVEALHRDGEPPRRAEVVRLAPGQEPRWAPPVDGTDGVVLRWEEAVDR